jgi:capsular polysaccharide biosynthesis protein
MKVLSSLLRAIGSQPARANADIDRSAGSIEQARQELAALVGVLQASSTRASLARTRIDELLHDSQRSLRDRARIAALPRATLLCDAIQLEGAAADRLARVQRLTVGREVALPFARWMGVTRCVSVASDVRDAWERLLAAEETTDGLLRCGPSTVLRVAGATIDRPPSGALHASVTWPAAIVADEFATAVPRFTYATPPRKLRNFSHWLLDCMPQVVTLSMVDPRAKLLVPPSLTAHHRSTLGILDISAEQMVPWNGAALRLSEGLLFESDGRRGGGRPLSALLEMRRRLVPRATPGRRRIYVSRRDAKAKRRWIANEAAVAAAFERRGFEIVCPTDHSLADLVGLFGEAQVIAGVNGAGLAHMLFSPSHAHVIVLFTESLMRWHADATGARSLWTGHEHRHHRQLATLGDSPRFYAHLAAAFEQYCHCFVAADQIPMDDLSLFVDEALARVERR